MAEVCGAPLGQLMLTEEQETHKRQRKSFIVPVSLFNRHFQQLSNDWHLENLADVLSANNALDLVWHSS